VTPIFPPDQPVDDTGPARRQHDWEHASPLVSTGHPGLARALRRSRADLGSLRIFDTDQPDRLPAVAAGAPWFMTVFGRDSLLTSLMALPLDASLALGTLRVLADLQGEHVDAITEEEPGKIIHELRHGLDSGSLPAGSRGAYFGSVDATPLFVMLVGELARWRQGDEEIGWLLPHVDRALRWIERFGDPDGDLFVEYRRKTDRGLVNQGWKDSFDGINFADGTLAQAPIALAEVQGYVFAARRSMAHLARHKGDTDLAARLDAAADTLQARFDAAFWLDDIGFYAMALDAHKRPVASIGSNPGQALWTGIIPSSRAGRVAERLLAPDMFSGWGIRTYAAGQPGYNPVGYHTGSIWPHDNALIAAGLKSSGAADGANLIAGRLIEVAQWFPDLRLPELFCGFARDEVGAPVAYPVACSPQAWAAAAPFHLLRTMLGLRADAHAHRLELVLPTLPEWLTKLTITGLPVGSDSVDLLVHRWRGRTSAELLGRRGSTDVIIHA
jgi:glycogen debranching enzyme